MQRATHFVFIHCERREGFQSLSMHAAGAVRPVSSSFHNTLDDEQHTECSLPHPQAAPASRSAVLIIPAAAPCRP